MFINPQGEWASWEIDSEYIVENNGPHKLVHVHKIIKFLKGDNSTNMWIKKGNIHINPKYINENDFLYDTREEMVTKHFDLLIK